jgi:Mg-chelatase subunit ChlD
VLGTGLGDDDGDGLKFANEVFNDSPGGKTPLCEHIRSVVSVIRELTDSLHTGGRRAAVIICSDGVATDGDVSEAMRPLENVSTVYGKSARILLMALIN